MNIHLRGEEDERTGWANHPLITPELRRTQINVAKSKAY